MRLLTNIPIKTSHCTTFHCTMGGLIDIKCEMYCYHLEAMGLNSCQVGLGVYSTSV